MVIVKAGKHKFYLDGYLQSNLDVSIKEVRKRDFDRFILAVGREGFGKTTLLSQCALYCDNTFNLNRVYFTPEQFLEGVVNADKYTSHLFDETVWGLGSRQAMNKINKVLIKVMTEMRSKNLFVFMAIPNFFMIDWYVAQHRTTGLLYIYKRGSFGSYDYPTKKKLYMQGKKYHSYKIPPNFIGRFVKYFPLDKEIYEKKKQQAIDEWIKTRGKEATWKQQRDILINKCISSKLMTREEVANLINISVMQVGRLLT
ncbi:MAG: hypothetical protein PVG65_01560 [Candidatus Thorarchaeota archaeon]|jgi:hypothetical protein